MGWNECRYSGGGCNRAGGRGWCGFRCHALGSFKRYRGRRSGEDYTISYVRIQMKAPLGRAAVSPLDVIENSTGWALSPLACRSNAALTDQ